MIRYPSREENLCRRIIESPSDGNLVNPIFSSDKGADAEELVLPLTEIAQLFNAPHIEPL
jgi:hypothetical protein